MECFDIMAGRFMTGRDVAIFKRNRPPLGRLEFAEKCPGIGTIRRT